MKVPLVLSHLVFRRDVGGHGLTGGVVGHDLLLERHHLVLVCWVGLLLAMVTSCSVSGSLYRVEPGLEGLLVVHQPLAEQPDWVVLITSPCWSPRSWARQWSTKGDCCLSCAGLSLEAGAYLVVFSLPLEKLRMIPRTEDQMVFYVEDFVTSLAMCHFCQSGWSGSCGPLARISSSVLSHPCLIISETRTFKF
jgi:hypothetical protein